MKKYFYFFFAFALLFFGCEKDFDETVQPQNPDYQVTSISSFKNFTYIIGDSVITLFISFRQADKISNTFANIYSSDGKKINTNPIRFFDDGSSEHGDITPNDKRFSNKFPLSQSYPNGNYKVEYFVTDNFGSTEKAAIQNFTYNNGQDNAAPVLSNLSMADSIAREQQFIFTVEVSDSNGRNDILEVYYKLFRPDGSQVSNSQGITKFPLFDDGKISENGDQTADDGIYTVGLTFPSTAEAGNWRFEFVARDRGGLLSNTITHIIVVQ